MAFTQECDTGSIWSDEQSKCTPILQKTKSKVIKTAAVEGINKAVQFAVDVVQRGPLARANPTESGIDVSSGRKEGNEGADPRNPNIINRIYESVDKGEDFIVRKDESGNGVVISSLTSGKTTRVSRPESGADQGQLGNSVRISNSRSGTDQNMFVGKTRNDKTESGTGQSQFGNNQRINRDGSGAGQSQFGNNQRINRDESGAGQSQFGNNQRINRDGSGAAQNL